MKKHLTTLAGLIAIAVALYHGVEGDQLLKALPLDSAQHGFVQGTYHIGTAGWLIGGALLIVSRNFDPYARRWVAGFLGLLYGGPALGTLFLFGPSLPGLALVAVVVCAAWGAVYEAQPQAPRQAPSCS